MKDVLTDLSLSQADPENLSATRSVRDLEIGQIFTYSSRVVRRGWRGSWPEWLGGATMVVAVAVPATAADAVGQHDGVIGKVAGVAMIIAGFMLLALVAPLVGARRRDVLWGLIPFWGVKIAWVYGAELVRLARVGRWQLVGETVDPVHGS